MTRTPDAEGSTITAVGPRVHAHGTAAQNCRRNTRSRAGTLAHAARLSCFSVLGVRSSNVLYLSYTIHGSAYAE